MNITSESLNLFLHLARDASDWSGTPMLDISKEQRGNLTQLKRAGLLTTFVDEGIAYASFTEAGVKLASTHSITVDS
jgi:hypothetical protein